MQLTETVISVTGAPAALEARGQSPGSVLVTAIAKHTACGVRRRRGDRYQLPTRLIPEAVRRGMIAPPYDTNPQQPIAWHHAPDRELRIEALVDPPWSRVVACLNVWNDRPALEQTVPTWIDSVDHVIAVDGAYASTGIPTGPSTDGTIKYLRQVCGEKLTLIEAPDGKPWESQTIKRSRYLLDDGSLLFVVDADEFVENAESLRRSPSLDVGWVTMLNPLYERPYGQPRVFRATPGLRYDGRHHWMYRGDALLTSHQAGGVGIESRALPVTIHNERGLGHDLGRRAAKHRHLSNQFDAEAPVCATKSTARSDAMTGRRESLRIVQLANYDPGLVGYRLHNAINATTPHASLFARQGRFNPFGGPSQYDPDLDGEILKRAILEADAIHCHVSYRILDGWGMLKPKPPVVIHHHGTWYRTHIRKCNAEDKRRAVLRLVSNLELLQYGNDLNFLPNPVPVARYRRLRDEAKRSTDGVLRIGHSPSKRQRKGTEAFEQVVSALQSRGYPLEMVMLEKMDHARVLAEKATCDLFFDSFDLGMQCSGLEAGAMGIPVIAGDRMVRRQYEALFGGCPYTFAESADELEHAIMRLADDESFRIEESTRVSQYIEANHDESAVALKLLDLLDDAIGWRSQRQEPKTQRPESVTTPRRRTPKRPVCERPQVPEPEQPTQRSA